jgi:tRNA-specific 2-thiouridylase
MSGGVDSSVAACLLLEQGYEVFGSQMKLLHLSEGVDHGCCGPTAQRDARAVAEHAHFPFEIVDMSETFAETVLEDFFSEHAAGRTPNPCARCNEQIKFAAFLDRADELGMDFVATGHYVRTLRDETDGRWHLYKGQDSAKDQSYMLHMLGQRQLARSLFPVGGQPKSKTREDARRFGLGVAAKPDSQEVCFVPGADHAAFIEEYVPSMLREGEVVDTEGQVLATHGGAHRFTIGQRRGLGVATGEPSYVVEVKPEENRVVIGPVELLARRGLHADRVSWVAGEPPSSGPFEAEVRIRYKSDDVPAVVEYGADANTLTAEFRSPQRAVAPGQSVVLYRGSELLGGARITSALS